VAGCIVAIDVAKTGFYAGIANLAGEVVSIIRFQHPTQTRLFLGVLEALRTAGSPPQVVMEPTGSYGDSIQHHCHVKGFPVFMSSPKHTHDMAEVLDGVPSMHDAKAVVVLAKLHAIRPGRRYDPRTETRRDLRSAVDRRQLYADTLDRYFGRLEALLARCFPELEQHINVRSQHSWMTLLEQFPGPESVAQQPQAAKILLYKASRGALDYRIIEALVDSAKDSLGVPMTGGEKAQLRELVVEIHRLTTEQSRLEKELVGLVRADRVASRLARGFGPALAAAIISYLGDPTEYDSAAALEKAAGLNLKVRSSGKYVGQLKITKRGPGIVRRLLHMAALRYIHQDPVVRAWYRQRKAYTQDLKLKAVVAISRKLIRAAWHVARDDAPFDSTKLFDTRRLKLDSDGLKKPLSSFAAKRTSAAVRTNNSCSADGGAAA
jgi:transposase